MSLNMSAGGGTGGAVNVDTPAPAGKGQAVNVNAGSDDAHGDTELADDDNRTGDTGADAGTNMRSTTRRP